MYPYDALKVYIVGVEETWLRLNSWTEGFRAENLSVSFEPGQVFSLALRYLRHQYYFELEGAAEMVQMPEGSSENTCSMEIRWTEEARRKGSGSAVIKMVNRDFPQRPSIFTLRMGKAEIIPEIKAESASNQAEASPVPWEPVGPSGFGC